MTRVLLISLFINVLMLFCLVLCFFGFVWIVGELQVLRAQMHGMSIVIQSLSSVNNHVVDLVSTSGSFPSGGNGGPSVWTWALRIFVSFGVTSVVAPAVGGLASAWCAAHIGVVLANVVSTGVAVGVVGAATYGVSLLPYSVSLPLAVVCVSVSGFQWLNGILSETQVVQVVSQLPPPPTSSPGSSQEAVAGSGV